MVTASSIFSNRLVDRFGTGPIIAVTMSLMAVGYLLFLRIDTTPSYVVAILPAVLLIGAGWIGFPAVNIQATSGIRDDEQGLAAGVLQTSMQVGAAIVLAVTTAIIASDPVRRPTPATMLDAYRPGLVFATVVCIVGAVVAVVAVVPRRARGVVATTDEQPEDATPEPDLAA
jgi:MFS family permease